MKTPKQLERYFKGAANHWRIAVLFLIEKSEGISLENIVRDLGGNFKTLSQHTRYLAQAGLINKNHRGRTVGHSLSPYGRAFVKFMRSFE